MGRVTKSLMHIADMMNAGMVVTFHDYKADMDAQTWALIVLWKEAESERNKPKD